MGVGPAWASMPCTLTSYQRWPSAALTTPITRSWFSSTGPCSIWASKYAPTAGARSEEHTSELQSQSNLVCRLLLEKKKKKKANNKRKRKEVNMTSYKEDRQTTH